MSRALRRPTLSPMRPKISAPIGRATKPTANVAKAAIVETSGSFVAKKSWLKTSDAAVP